MWLDVSYATRVADVSVTYAPAECIDLQLLCCPSFPASQQQQ
jgi:hypothetical protein